MLCLFYRIVAIFLKYSKQISVCSELLSNECQDLVELKVNDDITLRMLSARDSEALFRITDESRGYLKRWLPWLDSIRTSHDSLEFIKNTFHSYNNRTGITSGIFLHGELVGIIG